LGKIITSENALPSFTSTLARELRSGKVNRMKLNREVKDYIMETVETLYLNQKQWHFLCAALIKEYPVLSDPDDDKGYVSTT